MIKTGFSRPGAMQMVLASVLLGLAAVGPALIAVTRPAHEWSMMLSGLPAVALMLSGLVLSLVYFFGFLTYCSSKGYSRWLGLVLFLGSVVGLIALLLLPDLKAVLSTTKPSLTGREMSPTGTASS